MKTTPKLLVPILLMLAVVGIIATGPKATAQTLTKAEARAEHNSDTCTAVGKAANCTDAEALAGYCAALNLKGGEVCVDNRVPTQKVLDSAGFDAYLDATSRKAIFEKRRDEFFDRLFRKVRANCAAHAALEGMPTTFCR